MEHPIKCDMPLVATSGGRPDRFANVRAKITPSLTPGVTDVLASIALNPWRGQARASGTR